MATANPDTSDTINDGSSGGNNSPDKDSEENNEADRAFEVSDKWLNY